jgi:serine/threonine protein kinase
MELIFKSGEESYIYRNDDQIYKYTNDINKEYEILSYLNKADPTLPIPKVYSESSDVKDPSGKQFKKLIIMEYLRPLVKQNDMDILFDNQYTRREYVNKVIDILHQIHTLGVYHCDFHSGNTILTSKGIYLIDFGLARFKTDTSPMMFSEYYDETDVRIKYSGLSVENFHVLKFYFGGDMMEKIDSKLWINVPIICIKEIVKII